MQKNKIIMIIAISLAFLIVVGTLGVYGLNAHKRNKLLKQADALVAMEKYEDGINIYEQILSNKYINSIADKRDSAIKLMESKENYAKAMELFDADDYKGAIKFFLRVSKNDKKRYEQTLQQLNGIEETIFEEIRQDFESGNQNDALDRLNDYIKVVPTSVDAKNLKDELKVSIEEGKEKEEVQKEQAKKQVKKQAQVEKALSNTQQQAYAVKNTFQTVVAKNANLRVAPKIGADVLTIIPQGSECYVFETKVESADRFWCKVEYYDDMGRYYVGWISYNTMNYKF